MQIKSTKVFLLVLTCVAGLLASCQKEGYGDFSLSIKETGADYVDIFVTAPATLEMAYVVSEEPQLITPAVLFKTGTVVTVNPADVIRLDYGIFPGRKYHFYAAAREGEGGFVNVEMNFTTKDYNFTDMVSVTRTYYDGYMVHITVPEETKKRGNVIRYGSTSLAWYNLLKSNNGIDGTDLNAIVANGDPYHNYVKNDSTIVVDDWNVIVMDKDGNPVLDEYGQQIDIHDPIAPNEPTVFLAGECRYGTAEEFNSILGYTTFQDSAWCIPMWERGKGWTGAFSKVEFFTKEPELCDATVKIEIPEDEITVTDANVYFTIEGDVERYFYMILDNETFNQIQAIYLDNHSEWWQWFLTSYIAFYEWGVYPVTENLTVNAASSFVEPLTGGNTYHVLATVFGKSDRSGSRQNFVHTTFKAKEKTKPAPMIEVTKVDTGDPYKVAFNVKAGKDSRGNVQPIMGAYWVCNYDREFEYMFNLDYTYASLLKNMGNVFTSNDIMKINSDEGLLCEFDTLDGEVTRMAVYGCNDEYTFNLIDEITNTAAWEDYAAPMAEPVDRIDSPLFEKLSGEWTATATLLARELQEDETVISYDTEHSSRIVISSVVPELPETVEPDVYALYKGKDQKYVDNLYENLKDLYSLFGESRLEGQNRLLCTGFMDFDYYDGTTYPNRMSYMSPYDLFRDEEYSSIDVAEIIYDFGPKWFLEVCEDGSVIVPFHSIKLPPLTSWPGYPFYLGGYAENAGVFIDSDENTKGFPVEISDDYNTITIKPLVFTDASGKSVSYYLNACGLADMYSSEVEIIAPVKSEIVLKRGWKGASKASVAAVKTNAKAELRNIDGSRVEQLPVRPVLKSLTRFDHTPLPVYAVDEDPNVVTMEMVNATSDKILKYYKLK